MSDEALDLRSLGLVEIDRIENQKCFINDIFCLFNCRRPNLGSGRSSFMEKRLKTFENVFIHHH